MNWQTDRFHPLSNLFPVMGEVELRLLAADILKNGQVEPIVVLDGQILDGRNRFMACQLADVEPKTIEFDFNRYNRNPGEFVLSMNIHRRHLTPEQKRELIAKLLKADPRKSDRQIAKQTGSSPSTVSTVRKEKEEIGDVSKLDTRKDARGREQPSTKPAKATKHRDRGVLMLTSTLDELNSYWGPEKDPNGVYTVQVDCWLYTVKRVPPLVDPKSETGRAVREATARKIEEGIQTVKSSPKK